MILSRRLFLGSTATAAAGTLVSAGPALAADEFDTLRTRWRGLTLGTGVDAGAAPFAGLLASLGAQAVALRDSMSPATGRLWTDLNWADPAPDSAADSFPYSAAVTGSFKRLTVMATAWAQPGTGVTGDSALLTLILAGVDRLVSEVYNATQTRFGNWWDWQIGTPRVLMDLCSVLWTELGTTRITALVAANDHFVPDSAVASYTGTSTGANRVDLCRSLAFSGVIGKSAAKLVLARNALSPVFPLVASGDGFYADGSFVQHTTVPYTGTYGNELLGGLARLFALFAGSTWAVTDANRQLFLDSIDKSYAPFIYNGLVMDGVSGRAVSRGISATDAAGLLEHDHARGHGIINNILLLADGASAAERTRWRGMVKGWAARDYWAPLMAEPRLGVADAARLKALVDDSSAATAEPVEHRVFPGMDRAVHRRAGWAASVSMSSARITFYETGNGENKRGWHTGSGMLYYWGSTWGLGQYSDSFWATVDPYRLPGTTVSRKVLADAAGGAWGAALPNALWVGGSTDGKYGAIGQDFRGLQSTLTGRKSWFFLGDMIVCLGAGIACTDGTAVETTYDNRNLGTTGTQAFSVDGAAQPTTMPWSATFTGAKWAQGPFGGYLFLDDRAVVVKREMRTGRWSDVNSGGTTTAVSRAYLTMYRGHGTDPTTSGYAYAIMPGATAAQTQAAVGTVTVSVNSADRQAVTAVQPDGSRITAGNFFTAGTAAGITVSDPCSVLIRENGGVTTISAADPRRSATTVDVTWKGVVHSFALAGKAGVTVTKTV